MESGGVLMAIPVLIIGDSGTGKSTSLMNLQPETTLCIQSINKRLPFRSNNWGPQTKSIMVTDDYAKIHNAFNASGRWGKNIIVVDDTNYLMANENMRNVDIKGFDKFTHMAKNLHSIFDHAQKLPGDQRIYFMMHTQESDTGHIKPKTVGKLLDQQIVIEGLFTIVFRCWANDGRHYFTTKTNGLDPVKTPMDMFKTNEIDNDLLQVDNAIKNYYNLED